MSNHQEHEEDRSVVRQQNRALRSITRKLREQSRRLQEKADEIFIAVCSTNYGTEAEKAFGELWGSAEFDCGPQDYQWMVEQSIRAMRIVKAMETATSAQTETPTSEYADKIKAAIFR
jgi:hypothetical protein